MFLEWGVIRLNPGRWISCGDEIKKAFYRGIYLVSIILLWSRNRPVCETIPYDLNINNNNQGWRLYKPFLKSQVLVIWMLCLRFYLRPTNQKVWDWAWDLRSFTNSRAWGRYLSGSYPKYLKDWGEEYFGIGVLIFIIVSSTDIQSNLC